jgi:hypothetical protein
MQINVLDLLLNLGIGSGAGAGITFLLRTYFNEKIKNSIKHEYDTRLESHKSELKSALDKEIESYKSEIRDAEVKKTDKWKIKRAACMNALNIAEASVSNMTFADTSIDGIVKSEVDTVKVRECYNQLACSCDNPKTLEEFKRVLGLMGTIEMNALVSFRNAIRAELDFGAKIELASDDQSAFIGRIHGDPN